MFDRRPSCLPALLFALAISGELRAQTDANIVESFQIAKHGKAILLPVEVNGKEYRFLVDTGASISFFDRQLLPPVALRQQTMRTADEDKEVCLFEIPPAKLRSIDFRGALATAQEERQRRTTNVFSPLSDSAPLVPGIDCAPLSEVVGSGFHGLIGMDLLRNWTVRIDFDRGELSLSKRPRAIDGWESFDLSYDEIGCPLIGGRIPGWGEADFTIDTGWLGGGGLNRDLIDRLSARELIRDVGTTRTRSAAGDGTKRVYSVGKFALRNHLNEDLLFHESNDNRLGIEYLSRFNLVFDFPRNRLYLREGKDFNKLDERDLSGLHLLRRNEQTWIEVIDEGSAASKTSLNVGDKVLRVNDLDARRTPLKDLRRTLMTHDQLVRVTVEREFEIIEAEIELK